MLLIMKILWFFFVSLHPFKISVTEINYNKSGRSLDTTIKVFHDDLESALSESNSKTINVEENNQQIKSYLSSYFINYFQLFINQKKTDFSFVGYEFEDDVVWIYLEFKSADKLESVKLRNGIFTDTFPEQSNLVHFHYGDEIKSRMCSKNNPEASFSDFQNW